ncbi:LysM peptidoglycan-binding domain-containing protein [Bacillus sp. HNG]|uniref:LysM peptidoglycan-binding domain-containing protein n=1 Tax=Bacillus sp. HNG TaxID=2293325 RepID=UPI000E2E4ED0|nr:LysM peptidoglycan-binding domain-containing protein [Bacillus sp. HNG]RFB17006.1 LysM peptidoglycan-binding domain-containing protein [Bacillus sp. HNG]
MKQAEGEKESNDLKTSTSTLPPRSEFHKTKKKKTKVKIKYPIIRLLALLFVLLPVAILSYKFNSNPDQLESTPVKRSTNFESISYEDEDETGQAPEADEIREESENVEHESTVEKEEPKQPEVKKQVKVPTNEEPNQNAVEITDPPTAEETKVIQPVQQQEKPKDRYDVKYHTVKADETLYRISMHYYNSRSGEELIKRWNNLNGDTVVEGQVLRIPIKLN